MFRPIAAVALGFILLLLGPLVASMIVPGRPDGWLIAIAVALEGAGLFLLFIGLEAVRVVREYRASERDSADS